MIAAAEIGEHLIWNGAHALGQRVDGHAIPDQGGKIAAPRGSFRKLGHIHSEQIHRDATDDGATASSDDDLSRGLAFGCAGGAQETISVADGNDCNAAWPRGTP